MPHSITSPTLRPEYSFDPQPTLHPTASHSYLSSAASSRRNSLQSIAGANRRHSLAVIDVYGESGLHDTEGSAPLRAAANGSTASLVRARKHVAEEQSQQYKDSVGSLVRDRIQKESPVIAELRTNVIVKDEFVLVTDLSQNLARRYSRLEAAIMVKVDHSCCLAYGGSFDPCYILTVTAVQAQMGPAMNKRNAALLQSFLADILSVPPERGVIRFDPLPEENLAANGTTVLGEIERQEKQTASDMRRAAANTNRRSTAAVRRSSPPKLDMDFNMPSLGYDALSPVDSLNTFRTLDPLTETATSPVSTGSRGVYELPTAELHSQRPSTSYSQTAPKRGASSWLRSNSMKSDITSASGRLPNGRPKTFSGDDFKSLSISAPQLPQLNLSSAPSARRDRASYARSDFANRSYSSPRPQLSQQSLNGGKADSFLENVMSAGHGKLTTIADLKQSISAPRAMTTASSSRRPSITATPPSMVAPPIPADSSAKSQRISKRKSFFAAFRR